MFIKKAKTFLKPLLTFLKERKKKVAIIESLLILTTFCGYSILPFIRTISTIVGIFFAISFVICSILTLVVTRDVFAKYYSEARTGDSSENVRFLFYFLSLFLNGIIITIVFIIIKACKPNSQYLIQGIVDIVLLLVFYLLFGMVIYADKVLSALHITRNK